MPAKTAERPTQDRTNHTPMRRYRMADEPYDAAVTRAEADGLDISKVTRMLLEEYAAGRITVNVGVKQRRRR